MIGLLIQPGIRTCPISPWNSLPGRRSFLKRQLLTVTTILFLHQLTRRHSHYKWLAFLRSVSSAG
jgi:hypothetical protein